jgi:hypothetical protein
MTTRISESRKKRLLDEYETLLDYGLSNLEDYIVNSEASGPTGIEKHLVGRYLSDIMTLNEYMYTTASTNYPNDPKFQPMFIVGLMYKPYAFRLIQMLSKRERTSGSSRSPSDYYFLVASVGPRKYGLGKILGYNLPPQIQRGPYLLSDGLGIFQEDSYSDYEIPDFVSPFLRANLCYIIIEDSVKERRTLYDSLVKMCKRI